ncbi:unnamed protein product [Orchesella dallaii]|uniref:Uncharacterized protein n=1 Tax=Orchesella dallaii TaxID=48710 RepID=A0ABP1S6T9_9HEXA
MLVIVHTTIAQNPSSLHSKQGKHPNIGLPRSNPAGAQDRSPSQTSGGHQTGPRRPPNQVPPISNPKTNLKSKPVILQKPPVQTARDPKVLSKEVHKIVQESVRAHPPIHHGKEAFIPGSQSKIGPNIPPILHKIPAHPTPRTTTRRSIVATTRKPIPTSTSTIRTSSSKPTQQPTKPVKVQTSTSKPVPVIHVTFKSTTASIKPSTSQPSKVKPAPENVFVPFPSKNLPNHLESFVVNTPSPQNSIPLSKSLLTKSQLPLPSHSTNRKLSREPAMHYILPEEQPPHPPIFKTHSESPFLPFPNHFPNPPHLSPNVQRIDFEHARLPPEPYVIIPKEPENSYYSQAGILKNEVHSVEDKEGTEHRALTYESNSDIDRVIKPGDYNIFPAPILKSTDNDNENSDEYFQTKTFNVHDTDYSNVQPREEAEQIQHLPPYKFRRKNVDEPLSSGKKNSNKRDWVSYENNIDWDYSQAETNESSNKFSRLSEPLVFCLAFLYLIFGITNE